MSVFPWENEKNFLEQKTSGLAEKEKSGVFAPWQVDKFTRHLISNELLHTWLEGLRVRRTSDPAQLAPDEVSKL